MTLNTLNISVMRRTILIGMGALFMLNLSAQNPSRKFDREQIKAARIAFLTNRLDLDSKQAQSFWPIFNEYEKKKAELGKKYGEQKRALVVDRNYENMTDEAATKMLDIYIEQKEAEAAIEKEYLVKFKEVLTPQQTWKLVRFDSEFRRSLMQRLSRSSGQRPGNPAKKGN